MEDWRLIDHLAALVQVRLDEQEARELADDISEIQEMVDRVKTLDFVKNDLLEQDITPFPKPLREDRASDDRRVKLDQLTVHTADGFLVVPPVLGEDT